MELSDTLADICDVLNSHNIPYMVIGGYAVSVHGYNRFTEDIDITLGINVNEYEKVLNILPEINCKLLVSNPVDFINTTWVLPVLEEKSKTRIDFIFSFTDFESHAIKNSFVLDIKGKKIKFSSVNDLLVLKAFSGRTKDLEDIQVIYRRDKKVINLEYIYNWLEKFSADSDKDYVKLFNETIKE
ncbi:MAG: nucleotidyltransferase [Ignavibacteria bacterium]|nr:nucleotidyltransferase [Ignavibacteria bacterium]